MPKVPRPADYPPYSAAERRADRVIHCLGLGGAALAVPLMMVYAARWHGASLVTAAAVVYAMTLLAMLGFSAAYHMIDRPRLRDWLRRGDHAAIYAKIAGAYTPLTILHGGTWTLPLLTSLWGAAAVGMAVKILYPRRGDGIAVPVYVLMGWSAVLIGAPLFDGLSPTAFHLTVGGGLLYTVGVGFYLWESLPFQVAIWHGLVLAATMLVFLAILVELSVAAVPHG